MKNIFVVILFFLSVSHFGFTQDRFIVQNKKQTDKIKFKLINNLVVIPVDVNGVILSFILDTGVSKPIIFNFLNVSDTLKIKNTEAIFLRGLGEGEPVEALKSKNNIIKIGDALKLNQELYAVYGLNLNFAPRLGIPIHGIIGFDLFKDLIVEINYSNSTLKLTNPQKFIYKDCKNNCEQLNIEFYNNKPYINTLVKINNKKHVVKLLIDSGGSDALWLFEDDDLGITTSDEYFYDFLGHGLSGSVYGKRSRIEEFSLKSFVLKKPNVAFPDSTTITLAKRVKDRNGSLGGNILKRFNIIVDYKKAKITLRKNSKFKEKFSYNKSGIELGHNGVRLIKEKKGVMVNNTRGSNSQSLGNNKIVFDSRYVLSLKPAYTIVELRPDSPAEKAGLMIGDIILSINGKNAHQFSLQQIMYMFYEQEGKTIKLKVDRNGKFLTFSFKLENLFK